MRHTLIPFSLLFVLFIAGCGDNPVDTEPGFEPYQIGTWEITSPTNANWIGETTQAKSVQADTIDIKSPGQRDLKIFKQPEHEDRKFAMQFVDSTVNYNDKTEHDIQRVILEFPKTDVGKIPLGSGGKSMDYSMNYIKATISMATTCDHSGFEGQNPVIMVRYEKGDGSLFRAYRIHVDGMLQTVKDIAC